MKAPVIDMPKSNKNLTKEQMRLVEWLASPKDERNPKTLQELAGEIGVSPTTISRWRRNLKVDEMAAEMVRQMLFKDLPEVYSKLGEKAREGSYHHMRLFLETVNDHRQKIDITMDDRRSVIEEKLGSLLGDEEGE